MSEGAPGERNPGLLPSVDDVKPSEEGGPIARSGFNYQDEIAVGFLIDMLENPSLLKVHCETHDDVVLVWKAEVNGSTLRLAEFVQVKAGEPDQLWSVAVLCSKKGKARASLFEISLGRDGLREDSRFRVVTLRDVAGDLKILTLTPGVFGREATGAHLQALQLQLEKRFPNLESPKGNGAAYWLRHCFWDVRYGENEIRKDNLLRVILLSSQEGQPLLPEQAEVLLQELRAMAKTAGAARWEPDRDKKIITREALRKWWEQRNRELAEGATAVSGGKLREKMIEAGLPEELIKLAADLRRDYSTFARTPRYMEAEEAARLQSRVKSEVMSLQARFVAGQLRLDGAAFHSLCVDRMDTANSQRPPGSEDRSAFLKGCMYDIADRCFLRFARPTL